MQFTTLIPLAFCPASAGGVGGRRVTALEPRCFSDDHSRERTMPRIEPLRPQSMPEPAALRVAQSAAQAQNAVARPLNCAAFQRAAGSPAAGAKTAAYPPPRTAHAALELEHLPRSLLIIGGGAGAARGGAALSDLSAIGYRASRIGNPQRIGAQR